MKPEKCDASQDASAVEADPQLVLQELSDADLAQVAGGLSPEICPDLRPIDDPA